MSTTQCTACEGTVAVTARTCPHCGQRQPAGRLERPEWVTVIIALIFAGIAISVLQVVWR